MKKLLNYLPYLISMLLLFWFSLIVFSSLHVWTYSNSSNIANVSVAVVQAFVVMMLWSFYRKAPSDKRIFLWLFFANIAFFIEDISYFVLTSIIKIPTLLLVLAIYLPYLIWAVALIFFLSKIIVPNILRLKTFIAILALFFIFNLIVIFLFLLSRAQYSLDFSWAGIALNFSSLLDSVLFDICILCLICAEDVGMKLFLSGVTVIISSIFLFNYSVLEQTANVVGTYADLFWLLGTLLMFFGLLFIEKNKSYAVRKYFRKTNTIKSRLIFWTFGVSVSSFILFFIVVASFELVNKIVFAGLPFFITSYSVVVVILSILMGRYFEIPFKKIASNIEIFMLSNKNRPKIEDEFSIEEFVFLQKFILNAFQVNEEKDRVKKELGTITVQVAHDIRSPLAALDTIVTGIQDKIPEQERIMMRTAFRRINNIANDLVAKYKGKQSNPKMVLFIYVVLEDIISEKDLEYCHKNIRFELKLDSPAAAFLLTLGNYKEMRRMISNLINNAVNAMTDGGVIQVSCLRGQDFIIIKIKDEGCGIPLERITDLLSNNVSATAGIGLGLKHAKEYIQEHNGQLEIASILLQGTEVTLKLPALEKPEWLCTKIFVDPQEEIIIVDDDASIHDIWTKKLEAFKPLRRDFFTTKEAYDALNQNKVMPCFVLCDYEFMNQSENGLDFLVKLNIPNLRKCLVTSNVDQLDVVTRCEALGLQLLPKHLLPYVEICKKENIENFSNQADAILIDDDLYNHEFWQYRAKRKEKEIFCFKSFAEFEVVENNISKETPIFIDLNLKDISGLDVAKLLFEKGFKKLYIATGYADFNQDDYPFLSGVVGKEPPF